MGYCRDLLRRIGIGIAHNQYFIVGFGAVCTGAVLGIFGFALNTGVQKMNQPSLFPADLTRPILDVLFNPRRVMARKRKEKFVGGVRTTHE